MRQRNAATGAAVTGTGTAKGASGLSPLASDAARARHTADILKAVAHPLRLRIIALLCHEEQHVSGLTARLGARQSVVSQQLRILRMRRLVDVTRVGGFARYRILEPQLRNLVQCMEGCSIP